MSHTEDPLGDIMTRSHSNLIIGLYDYIYIYYIYVYISAVKNNALTRND